MFRICILILGCLQIELRAEVMFVADIKVVGRLQTLES